MKAWIVRTIKKWDPPSPQVSRDLRSGWARIGWSQRDDLDLRILDEHIRAGRPLDSDQRLAKRCRPFYTKVAVDDYLLYPHQPERDRFSIVRVTGDYDYEQSTDDFRSRRPCEFLDHVHVRDEIVPSQLRNHLARQGRLFQIRDIRPFALFLEALPDAGNRDDGTGRAAIARIHKQLRQNLPDALHREFGRAELSRQFCRNLFDRMGYAFEVQEGRSERGSDVIVSVGDPLLPEDVSVRVGVQVFSYTGKVEEDALRAKLDQLLSGWTDNTLDYGLLLTTGRCTSDAKKEIDEHNRKNPKQLVRLIEGDDLADLFLQNFRPGGD